MKYHNRFNKTMKLRKSLVPISDLNEQGSTLYIEQKKDEKHVYKIPFLNSDLMEKDEDGIQLKDKGFPSNIFTLTKTSNVFRNKSVTLDSGEQGTQCMMSEKSDMKPFENNELIKIREYMTR